MKRLLLSAVAICMTAMMFAVNFTGGQKFYLQPNSNWAEANARFAVYAFGDNNVNQWYSMTQREDGIYEVAIPAEDKNEYTGIIFCRMNPESTNNNWGSKWNQTADIIFDGAKNFCVIDEGPDKWNNSSTMQLPVKVSAPNKAFINEEIAISATPFDNATTVNTTITVKKPEAAAFEPAQKVIADMLGDYEMEATVEINSISQTYKLYSRAVIAIDGGKKFYLELGNVWALTADIRFAAYFFDPTGKFAWVDCTLEGTKCTIIAPQGKWCNIIFCSMKANTTNDWANKIDQTIDLEYNGQDDTYTINKKDGEKYVGSWSKSGPDISTATNSANTTALVAYTENATIIANKPCRIFTITGVDVTNANGSLTKGAYIVRSNNEICKVMIR